MTMRRAAGKLRWPSAFVALATLRANPALGHKPDDGAVPAIAIADEELGARKSEFLAIGSDIQARVRAALAEAWARACRRRVGHSRSQPPSGVGVMVSTIVWLADVGGHTKGICLQVGGAVSGPASALVA